MPRYGDPLEWEDLERKAGRAENIDPEALEYIQNLIDTNKPGGRLYVGSDANLRKEKLATSRAARRLDRKIRWRSQKPKDGMLEFVLYREGEDPPGVRRRQTTGTGGGPAEAEAATGRRTRG